VAEWQTRWIQNPLSARACGFKSRSRHHALGPTPPILFHPMDIQKSLSELGERLTRTREDLRIVEEQLLFQMDVLEEAKTRMLVAETPLADREFRVAREDHDRLVEERARVSAEIAELQMEQDRLLDRMLAVPPV
jgi:hypothetical protein